MKKEYITPEMEITEFDTEDIITTSGLNGHDGAPGGSEGSGNFSDFF